MDIVSVPAAALALKAGKVVAYPTETIYGLGVNPLSNEAVERLFEVKGREKGKPILLVVANEDQLDEVVAGVSQAARACMQAFWPGPLSLLFPRSPRLPESLTAGMDKVCIRCTSSSIARDLCLAFGGAITSSSANRSGERPAHSLTDICLPGVSVAVDGGMLPPSVPSTVFDPDTCEVLRPGAVTEEQLRAVVGR